MALTKIIGEGAGNLDKLGIGTASPAKILHVEESTTGTAVRIAKGGNYIDVGGSGSGTQYVKGFEGTIAFGNVYAGNTTFLTGDTERMRIDSSGNLLIGVTSFTSGGGGVQLGGTQATREFSASGTGAIQQIGFHNPNGEVGSIYSSSSSTVFATSSDYRLKENIDYTWDATTRLKQLKPARFNFIADDTNTLVDGFIAHEAATVVPEAVIGTKDAINEDGNIKPQGIDQSKLVPLLVKTIQELEARITALESV